MGISHPSDARPVSFVSTEERLHITIRIAELLDTSSTDETTRGMWRDSTEGKLLLFEAYKWRDIVLQVMLRYYPNGNNMSIPEVEFEAIQGVMPERIRILLQIDDDPPHEGIIEDNIARFPPIRIDGDFDTIDVIFEYLEQDQVA